MRLGDFSPVETAKLLAECSAVAGLHGAAFSNMVFAPPGLKVVEIFRAPNRPWYSRLAQASGHHHTGIFAGESPDDLASLAARIRLSLSTDDGRTSL